MKDRKARLAVLATMSVLAVVFAPNFSRASEFCNTDICVLVPDSVTFSLNANTNEATVDPLTMKNNSSSSINVESITTEITDSAYSFETFDSDFSNFEANSKKIALAIETTDSTISDISGSNGIEFNEIIPAGNISKYNLKGKSSAFTESVENATVAKIVFTFSATEDSPKTTGCNSTELEKWNYEKNDTTKKITLGTLQDNTIDKTIVVCESYIINGETYSTELGENFEIYPTHASEIEEIIFGKNVDSSQMTNMSYMFAYLFSLENITLPNNFGVNATEMQNMFNGTNLKHLDLTNLNTSKAENITEMFKDNPSLETIVFPENFGSAATSMENMFSEDVSLKTIDLGKFDFSNIENTVEMFQWSGIETIYAPEDWSANNIKYSLGMFDALFNLTGSAGTVWNANNPADKTYARIDNGYNGEPGYFTDKKYKIHLNPNGGNLTFAEEKQDIKSIEYSELQDGGYNFNLNDFTVSKYIPTREGYTFLGWDENQNATTPTYAYNSANNTFSTSTVNVDSFNTKVLYAIWQDLPKVAKAILTEDGNLNFIYNNKTYTEGEEYSYTVDDINYVTSEIKTVYTVPENSSTSNKPNWTGSNISGKINYRTDITSANFDFTFYEFTPSSTAFWFDYDRYLSSITNAQNLNVSNVTNMAAMFYQAGYSATTFSISNLNDWNVSSVTAMGSMFAYAGYSATTWNIGKLDNWKVSNVTRMSSMFEYAGYSATTWDIGKLDSWNVSSVTDMSDMFRYAGHSATTWDIGNLDSWNVGNVTDTYSMFSSAGYSATTWNIGKLDSWNVSSVTKMSSMFSFAGYSADTWSIGDLGNWNVGSVTDMSSMFSSAGYSADTWNIGDLGNWNVGSVTKMSSMFFSAGGSADTWNIGDLGNWNVSSVTSMSSMFYGAGYSADTWSIGDLGDWNVSNVTNMSHMFFSAGRSAADTWNIGDLDNWNVNSVTSMFYMFSAAGYSATTWNIGDLDSWNVSSVTNMSSMFSAAGYSADTWSIGDLSKWNVSNVTSISVMFDSAGYSSTTWDIGNLSTKLISAADSPTGESYTAWDVRNIQTFGSDGGSSFVCGSGHDLCYRTFGNIGKNVPGGITLDLSDWTPSSATDMRHMFENANIKTIYSNNDWATIATNIGANSTWMFGNNTNLKGGNNTTYSSNNANDISYAHPDEGTSNPGYFTYKCATNCSAKAILTNDGNLNFIYDNKTYAEGKEYSYTVDNINYTTSEIKNVYTVPKNSTYSNRPGWVGSNENGYRPDITTANIDSTFYDFTPTSTSYWFYFNNFLSTITNINNLNTSDVVNMSSMFRFAGYDSSSFSLNLSNLDTSNVIDMSYLFKGVGYNSSSFSLDLSGWNTSNVTDMSYMFSAISNKVGIEPINGLSSFDTSKVINMRGMFYYTVGRTSIPTFTVGDLSTKRISAEDSPTGEAYIAWNTSNVTDMSQMFDQYLNRTRVWHIGDISNWNTSNVTNMSNMFNHVAQEATEWSIGDLSTKTISAENSPTEEEYIAWNTSNVTTMNSMFAGAAPRVSNFSLGDIGTWDISNVTNMSRFLYSSPSWTGAGENATDYYIGNIANWNTTNITSMNTMLGGIGGKMSDYELDLSGWNTSSVTDMHLMFYESNIRTIYVSNQWTTRNVTFSEDMFAYATNLVGGAGTVWDSQHIDAEYARIDRPDLGQPGYFTYRYRCTENCTAKAILTEDGNLNFIYDNQTRSVGESYTYSIDDGMTNVTSPITAIYAIPDNPTAASDYGWTGTSSDGREDITSTNFEPSFKDYKPTTSANWFNNDANICSFTNLQNLNTENVTNMEDMFINTGSNCPTFNLDLSTLKTDRVTNMQYMFARAGENADEWSIGDVSNWNTENVTNMRSMFNGAARGTENNNSTLTISGIKHWNVSNVTQMRSMFGGFGYNYKTFELDLDDWHVENLGNGVSSVQASAAMFSNAAQNSKNVTFSAKNWNLANATNIQDMFQLFGSKAENLSIDLSTWNVSNIQNMNVLFGCAGQYSKTFNLNLSGWDVSNVKQARLAFYYAGLEAKTFTLNISGWNISNLEDATSMFENAGRYSTNNFIVDLSNWSTTNLTEARNMFSSTGATTIYVGENWTTDGATSSNGMLYGTANLIGGAGTVCKAMNPSDKTYAKIDGGTDNPGCFTDTEQLEPKAILLENETLEFVYDNIKRYSEDTYNLSITGDVSIKSKINKIFPIKDFTKPKWINEEYDFVNINESFRTFKPTTLQSWFSNSKIESLTNLQNLNTENVESMGDMFKDTTINSTLDLSSWNTTSLYDAAYMFAGSNMPEIIFPESFGSNINSMEGMFLWATSENTLNLSNWSMHNVTSTLGMFESSGFSQIIFPEIFGDNLEDATEMFYDADSLTSLDLSGLMAIKLQSADYMFGEMYNLHEIMVSASFSDWSQSTYVDELWSEGMFLDTPNLPNYSYDDANNILNAHVGYDGEENPGYFTLYKEEDYSTCTESCTTKVLQAPGNTLFFVYDDKNYDEYEAYDYIREDDEYGWVGYIKNAYGIQPIDNYFEFTSDPTDPYPYYPWHDTDPTNIFIMNSFSNYELPTAYALFNQLGTLTSIYGLKNLNTTIATDMSDMFSGTGLKTIKELNELNTSNIQNMRRMFAENDNLTELDITNFDISQVKNFQEMFANNPNLEHIYAAEGTDWSNIELADDTRMYDQSNKLRHQTNGLYYSFVGIKRAAKGEGDDILGNFTSICVKNPSHSSCAPQGLTFEQAFERSGKEMLAKTIVGYPSQTKYYFKMQDMSPEICSAVAPATSTSADDTQIELLIDTRSNYVYSVAKLLDGNCWMTRDLALDVGATLTSEDTDLEEGKTMTLQSVSAQNTGSPMVGASTFDDDNYFQQTTVNYNKTSGWHYNTEAALALSAIWTTEGYDTGDDAPQSICPKGWKLPSGTISSTQPTPNINVVTSLYNSSSYNNTPLNYTTTGIRTILGGTVTNSTNYSYYLTSTFSKDGYDAVLAAMGINTFKVGSGQKKEGALSTGMYLASVRCVVAASTQAPTPEPTPTPAPQSTPTKSSPAPKANASTSNSSSNGTTVVGLQDIENIDKASSETNSPENAKEENTEPLGVSEDKNQRIYIVIPLLIFLIIILPLLIILIRKKKKEDEQYIEEF